MTQPARACPARAIAWLCACMALLAATHPTLAQRKLGTLGPPPRQDPQRQTSAESLPPLPLPATPMRRSEPKAEPAPPLFMGKLKYGDTQDYMPNPGDVDNLLRQVRYQLDAWYGYQLIGIDEITAMSKAGKPCQLPLLYITGYQKFTLTDEQRDALREYLLDGGTLLGDPALGSPEFVSSFRAEIEKMFTDRRMEVLQLDHPVMRGYYQYANVHYFTVEQGVQTKIEGPPQFYGLNLAARTAVILSAYDLTCGWDGRYAPAVVDRPRAPDAPSSMAMIPGDALRMGVNLVAYVSAERRFAKTQAQTRLITGDQPQKRAAVKLGLLRHQGDWNPDPNALYQLIRLASARTSVPMEYDLKPLDPMIEQLADTPIVIMTGMSEPKLDDAALDALRRHLQAGGFLFINNTSGFAKFDREVRAMLTRLFPDQKLEAVPPEHALFHSLYNIDAMRDAGTLAARPAELEAITIDRRAVVVYSRNDTLGMLKGIHDPYANAYDADSARKLALNILTYAAKR
ncbi:MAG: DUF4159 domain-containing protein [Planctomycetes bacterium]|nr:DUF4159 domain-containing protein [Planctomycetota bacterium]